MTKIELIEETTRTILNDGILSTDELGTLLEKAKNQDEVDFYAQIYNYLLGKRQQEVIANERY